MALAALTREGRGKVGSGCPSGGNDEEFSLQNSVTKNIIQILKITGKVFFGTYVDQLALFTILYYLTGLRTALNLFTHLYMSKNLLPNRTYHSEKTFVNRFAHQAHARQPTKGADT